jgi:hypothetical protein
MNITTLAAWGEFLGGIGVIVSLIYLASQIRQNSRLLRASTASATAQNFSTGSTLMVQDPEVARIFWSGIKDRDSLPEEDRARFDPLLSMQMDSSLQQFEFGRIGIDLPLTSERLAGGLRWQMQQLGAQQWWRDWSHSYPKEFREHVDGLIREGDDAG